MVLKCYPCIRGCGYVKGLLGGVLLLLTVYITGYHEEKLDCNEMYSKCILSFGVVIDQTNNRANLHLTRLAEVKAYCECFQTCMNYMSIFHASGMALDGRNCFRKTAEAGLAGVATNGKVTGTVVPLLPILSTTDCTTCADAAEGQSQLEATIGILTAICGVGMCITAGCEHVELKFHNACFSLGVLVLDAFCGVMLIVTMGACISGAYISREACDPGPFAAALKQAGTDTVSNEVNQAAIFADFLDLLLEPLAEGVCDRKHQFSVCVIVTAVSSLSNLWSFLVTLFLCLGCTDDGLDHGEGDDSDNEKAMDLHALMNFN